jgi:hypothetical protein
MTFFVLGYEGMFLVFFDDILVYSKDWKTHLQHLEEVLKLLSSHSLAANKKKCYFGQRSVEYCT